VTLTRLVEAERKTRNNKKGLVADLLQAVIRLSKKYLPGMAISYQHPKVKVHVGDGFKFLDDYKNEFDVIITDSSDPEGPAESLFQKPYFELLFGALKEGGVITTQGCTFSYVIYLSFRKAVLSCFSQTLPVSLIFHSYTCIYSQIPSLS
jgi:spermidine synthase